MIISVRIKLFLDVFNYKVILNVFIIFYLKKYLFQKFFSMIKQLSSSLIG